MYKCDEGIAGIMLKLNSIMMTNISDGFTRHMFRIGRCPLLPLKFARHMLNNI